MELALNNLQGLICHKTKLNQTSGDQRHRKTTIYRSAHPQGY